MTNPYNIMNTRRNIMGYQYQSTNSSLVNRGSEPLPRTKSTDNFDENYLDKTVYKKIMMSGLSIRNYKNEFGQETKLDIEEYKSQSLLTPAQGDEDKILLFPSWLKLVYDNVR